MNREIKCICGALMMEELPTPSNDIEERYLCLRCGSTDRQGDLEFHENITLSKE